MRKTKRSDKLESADLIARRLTDLLVRGEDEVPDGYYSLEQLSKISGRSQQAIRIGLIGKCEKVLLRRKTKGTIRRVVFYKV